MMTEAEGRRPLLVVLTPVYDEEDNIDAYVEEVSRVLMSRPDIDVRVLFVDDGSRDGSWKRIEDVCIRDRRFEGIRLSRNFGSHVALSAGFHHADRAADAVVTLACDLQDPPEVVLEFVERWRRGARIVWGSRRSRGDSRWRVIASSIFRRLLRRYAMPKGSQFTTGSFLLADRLVVECIREFREHNRITFALVAWTGFEQDAVEYDRRQRVAGASGWSFAKMVSAMYDAFVGFSVLPIRLITLAGAAAFFVASGLVIYLVVLSLAGDPVPGWTSQTLLLSGFFAVQFSLMAIVGEYLYRIYAEVVQRPLFFVSEQAGGDPQSMRSPPSRSQI